MGILTPIVDLSYGIAGLLSRAKEAVFVEHTDNALRTGTEIMFVDVEPDSQDVRERQWRARMLMEEMRENPHRNYFEVMDELHTVIAKCQGIRRTHEYGEFVVQARILRAEDKIAEALELLGTVLPDEEKALEAEPIYADPEAPCVMSKPRIARVKETLQ